MYRWVAARCDRTVTYRALTTPRSEAMHTHKPLVRWSLFGLASLLVIVIDMPIISLILNSFRSTEEILSSTTLVPEAPSLVNYSYVAQRTSFFRYLLNSLVMAGGGMALSIVAATLAGYVLSRFHTRVFRAYGTGLFLVQMFPILLALIPLFILFRTLGLVNTPYSVIIMYKIG